MNVGLCTETMNIGGAATLAIRQAKWLKAHGHGAVVFSAGGALVRDLELSGIPHVPVDFDGDAAPMQRAAVEFRLDAVVAQAKRPYPFAESAIGDNVRVYFDLISPVYFPEKNDETAALVRNAAQQGRILAGSTGDALKFAAAFDIEPRRIHVCNVPIDEPEAASVTRAEFRASLGIADTEVVVLTVARLDGDRAPVVVPVTNAVRALSKRLRAPLRYVVVGDGTESRRLRAKARSAIFTGFRRDLADFYNAADIFVGEGSVVQDAAARELPSVITSTTAKPHLGNMAFSIFGMHVVTEYVSDASNVVTMTPVEEALRLLLQNRARTAEIATAGQSLVTRYWHVDAVMEKRLRVYADPKAEIGSIASCRRIVEIEGGDDAGVERFAAELASSADAQEIGVVARRPIPWRRYFSMPLHDVQALCAASARTAYVSAGSCR